MLVVVNELGAVGDGETICTAALQRAIDTCAAAGGGMVYIPAGNYVTGGLWMRSHVNLYIESGATLLGAQDPDAFPICTSKWEGPGSQCHMSLISGEGLENVSITGRGTIDGRGEMWWKQHLEKTMKVLRPRLIRLIDCRNVLIEDITLKNSPAWTVNPVACDNVTISAISIYNPPDSPNTDGINPDSCRNVRISNCHIDVGDDCITIKSGAEEQPRQTFRPCENIAITNCTMMHGHGGIVIGSEMSGGVRNVVISNCTFVGTDRGIRIKTRRGRGGFVEDIRVNNIVMDGVLCPIVINCFYGWGAWGEAKIEDRKPWPIDKMTPAIRRLHFSNITARNAKFAAMFVLGLPELPVEDLACNNISIYLDSKNTVAGEPDMAPHLEKLCRAGFVLSNVRELSLRNVDVSDQLGPALRINDGSHLLISGFSARTTDAAAPIIHLTNIDEALLSGCIAPRRTKTFLKADGMSREISLTQTHAPQCEKLIDASPNIVTKS